MTSDAAEQSQSALRLLSGIGRMIAWIGASATAIGVVLAVFGYLVESAYLASFGIRRGVIDLGQNEYILSGGQFLIGVPGLMLAGALEFAVHHWYLVLLIAAIAIVGRWRRLRPAFYWLTFAILHTAWLAWILPALDQAADPATARAQVAMLTLTTMAALAYAWLAHRPSAPSTAAPPAAGASTAGVESPVEPASRYTVARGPYLVVLVVAIVMLPYVRGAHGLLRTEAIVELGPKEAEVLCGFACGGGGCAPSACPDEQWQLIAFGKDKVVLKNVRDGKIYVSPASAAQTFRIRPPDPACDVPGCDGDFAKTMRYTDTRPGTTPESDATK